MTRPTLLFSAALAAALVPAAFAGGPPCGCAAPVVPGATVDLEFAGCPGCAAVGPTCGAPAVYGHGQPVYTGDCCDNRDYSMRPGCGTGNGFTGGLRRLWDLEKKKNAWLKKTFIDGPKGKLCGLQDDCAPVCAPVCGATCAAPVYAPADCGCGGGGCDAGFGPAGCGEVYAPADPCCAAPVAVPGCAAPAFAAPTCGCN